MRMLGRRLLLLAPALTLARCAGAPPPPVLDLTVLAGADQNPDAGGHPTAIDIRLYQLAATDAFLQADVFAITEHAAETLGADLLGAQRLVLAPGERHMAQFPLKPGTRFLGAVALFRDIDRAAWRAQAPVAANGPTTLTLATSRLRLGFA